MMTPIPRSSSPRPALLSDLEKYDKNGDGVVDLDMDVRGTEDEEKTVFGSNPSSRFSTRRGLGGILKRKPFFWGDGGNTDAEIMDVSCVCSIRSVLGLDLDL